MHVADNARLENRKSSNGLRIAWIARILKIFGAKIAATQAVWRKKSNDRNERKVPEKFEKLSKKFSKNSQKIDIADVINY